MEILQVAGNSASPMAVGHVGVLLWFFCEHKKSPPLVAKEQAGKSRSLELPYRQAKGDCLNCVSVWP